MRPPVEETEGYAQAVRDALADVPEPDRAELLEDLEDHLAEVSAESGESLTARLGTPEQYAAELRAAYGADAGRQGRRRSPQAIAVETIDRTEAWFRRRAGEEASVRAAWAFIQELRPVWWLLRAYFAAVLVWRILGDDWYRYPQNFLDWVVLVVFVVGSVGLGMWCRTRASGARRTAIVGNLLVIALILAIPQLTSDELLPLPGNNTMNGGGQPTAYAPPTNGDGSTGMTGIVNIQPFSKDGKPLKDVLLYDQDGRPVQTDYQSQGLELRRCDGTPPISNSYPLALQSPPEEVVDPNGNVVPSPSPSCAPASPSPNSSPSGSPSPSNSPSSSPSKSPSPSPTPSPSRTP